MRAGFFSLLFLVGFVLPLDDVTKLCHHAVRLFVYVHVCHCGHLFDSHTVYCAVS